MKKRYEPPKFKRGQIVKIPSGEEREVETVVYHLGINWYLINDRQYAETELHEI